MNQHLTDNVLPRSISSVIEILSQTAYISPEQVRITLLKADTKPYELDPWADFDHPIADSYGRKLIYKGTNFEVMVMSWCPGDYSTIHDHGYTQWGAVQVFGPAEHAIFQYKNDRLTTLSREYLQPNQVISVQGDLIHQMGNPTEDDYFLSLHIYGTEESTDNVTGEASIYDVESQKIYRVNGGVFWGLPSHEILKTETGPEGDLPTKLRHNVEYLRRLLKMRRSGLKINSVLSQSLQRSLFCPSHFTSLKHILASLTDTHQQITDTLNWRLLRTELKAVASLQDKLVDDVANTDAFRQYAFLYDELIGRPSLKDFIDKYLRFVKNAYALPFELQSILSVGCGTGLVEAHMIDTMGVDSSRLMGLDISPAMIEVAQTRINAIQQDLLTFYPNDKKWDIIFSGLNVLHYVDSSQIKTAIGRIADALRSGGYFIGDFITPDHIRWYPHIIYSQDHNILSLREPRLVEEAGKMYQASDIINVQCQENDMRITYAGTHKRFLPPVHRIRMYMEEAFGGFVDLYDAVTLEPIPDTSDSCVSTRYIVVAKKL